MRRERLLFWLAMSLFCFLTLSVWASEKNKLHLVYISKETPSLKLRDIQLGYEFLINRIASRHDYTFSVDYSNDDTKAIQDFQQQRYDYIALPISMAAKYFRQIEPYTGEIYISSQADEMFERYLTVVPANGSSDTHAYMGKRAAIQKEFPNPNIYADSVCMDTFGRRLKDSFSISYVESSNRALLKLFFGQADIVFVSEKSWETAIMMNPALTQKLKVISTSPQVFAYGIEIFHKNIRPDFLQKVIQTNNELERSEDGRQALRIMKITHRKRIPMQELKEALKFYQAYFQQVSRIPEKPAYTEARK